MIYEHPVITILNRERALDQIRQAMTETPAWTGSLEEELTNQDMLDAEEAL